MHLVHVITGLDVGGAETMLYRLAGALGSRGFRQRVVSLTSLGPVAARLERLGVPCQAIGMRRGILGAAKLLSLARLLRDWRPDVVQTWMYHADLVGGIAARLAGHAKVVWGIHASRLDADITRWTTFATLRACALLAGRVPDEIICVSQTSRDFHLQRGYPARKLLVVPNGFDLASCKPDPSVRRAVRRDLEVSDETVLVGLVARVHPQKDHRTFIRAAQLLSRRHPEVRFLLCGSGATPDNDALVGTIVDHGVCDRFLLLGARDDVPRLLNGLDIAALSSMCGEAFPLAIGEAMASGVPCAVTDVGDSASLVGDTGRVVPPRDAAALATAIEELVTLGPDGRRQLGASARARIEAHYALPQIAARYSDVYRHVAAGVPATLAA